MVTLAVWFVAGQSVLSYVTAGIAKVASPIWTNGEALRLIMGSESHGQLWVSSLLEAHPRLGKLLTQSVVFFECAFPLILFAPRELGFAMLTVGIMFHLACAATMGLNAFLMAFPGSYLCVAYAAQKISPFWLKQSLWRVCVNRVLDVVMKSPVCSCVSITLPASS